MSSMADRSGGFRWLDRLPQVGRWRYGAGGFLVWWGRSLAAWLPARLRLALGLDRGRLLLQAADEVVQGVGHALHRPPGERGRRARSDRDD